MLSQAPLLIQTSYAERTYFFMSLCEQKIYCTKMDYFWGYSYAGFSRGYVIMARANNTLLLLNPFTRRKKEITGEAFQRSLVPLSCHAILAYAKDSEEYIVVLLCDKTSSLYIYQSRNSCWATYLRWGDPWRVVDFVVFHHTVYVITDEAKIGVLSLNSTTLKFLELNNVPSLKSKNLKLVSCDGKLLVVHFEPREKLEVYKIDFSSMDWVKLETLGDVALFYSKRTKCYALSNPGMWGYERNRVYYIDQTSARCEVYSMNNKVPQITIPGGTEAPPRSRPYWLDWCFRHVCDEVDYSLVE